MITLSQITTVANSYSLYFVLRTVLSACINSFNLHNKPEVGGSIIIIIIVIVITTTTTTTTATTPHHHFIERSSNLPRNTASIW